MWTKEWPKKNGFYWFYGKPSCSKNVRKKQIILIETMQISKDLMLCVNLSDNAAEFGESLLSKEKTQGVWQEIKPPKLPEDNNDSQ